MISSDTIATMINEIGKQGEKTLQFHIEINSKLFKDEPIFAAMCSQLFQTIEFKNPLTAAHFCIGLYFECVRRQEEADKLGKQTR